MTAWGAGLLNQAGLASLPRLGQGEQPMSPGRLGLIAAGPPTYRKVAA